MAKISSVICLLISVAHWDSSRNLRPFVTERSAFSPFPSSTGKPVNQVGSFCVNPLVNGFMTDHGAAQFQMKPSSNDLWAPSLLESRFDVAAKPRCFESGFGMGFAFPLSCEPVS